MKEMLSQQDSATTHTVRASMEAVERMFAQHVIPVGLCVSSPPLCVILLLEALAV